MKRITLLFAAFALLAGLLIGPGLAELPSNTNTTSNAEPFDTETAKTFAHRTANVNNVRLHYVQGGKGDAVVLLHGFGSTWYMWRYVMPALAQRYTVIAPDLRGAGDSSKPTTGYDKRTLAEDIYQLVRERGAKRVYLVGHDIGVMVAYAYAAAHPDEVSKLVILDSVPPGSGDWDNYVREPKRWHFAFHQAPNLPEALVAGRERMYLNRFWQDLAYNPTAITEADKDEYLRGYAAPGGMRAAFEYYRTMPQDVKDNKEYFKRKLAMPILALGGVQGNGKLVLDFMKTVSADVSGGVIEQCGHWIAEERPEYLIQQLLTFFGEA